MLTCISNFLTFKDKFNEGFTQHELKTLAKNLILSDEANFNRDSVVGGGFTDITKIDDNGEEKIVAGITEPIFEYIIDNMKGYDHEDILIINDLTFELYDKLTEYEYDPSKIYMAFGSLSKDDEESKIQSKTIYEIIRKYAIHNFKEFADHPERIYNLNEVLKMSKKFDFIIANPPYGIGGGITAKIISSTNFDNYINLMPVSKYKTSKLFKHVEEIEKAEDTFEDASIGDCLAIAKLKKEDTGKFNSWDDFSLVTYEERFRKFYKENRKRPKTFIQTKKDAIKDKNITYNEVLEFLNTLNIEKDFFVPARSCVAGVNKDRGTDREWNIAKSISAKELPIGQYYTTENNLGWQLNYGFIKFSSKLEKDNFTNFWYHNSKSGLMHKLIKGLNKHNGSCDDAIPRVDWSRPWTDEELLRDYGYTEEEITEILNS